MAASLHQWEKTLEQSGDQKVKVRDWRSTAVENYVCAQLQ